MRREKENDFFNVLFLPWVLKNHIIKQVISLRFPLDRGMCMLGGGLGGRRDCLFRTQIKLLEEVFFPADLLPPRSCPPPPPWLGNRPQNGKLLRKKIFSASVPFLESPKERWGEK